MANWNSRIDQFNQDNSTSIEAPAITTNMIKSALGMVDEEGNKIRDWVGLARDVSDGHAASRCKFLVDSQAE